MAEPIAVSNRHQRHPRILLDGWPRLPARAVAAPGFEVSGAHDRKRVGA
ncbi:hypothetical protein [Thioalkalivibrio paradoxus]|uniref:Uncharacterized protein n=1 Tax=Thioalkalivibrio paradoxus ARh 1 TaxID=713585 RepID=W0DML8_9GAMM|nr:hypothetical protein [Thioalkalivibrio paradoxus]AHE99834.1 hypothetical protein THITH_01385 [Thioalkalivibrio paradoxus ARh 1]